MNYILALILSTPFALIAAFFIYLYLRANKKASKLEVEKAGMKAKIEELDKTYKLYSEAQEEIRSLGEQKHRLQTSVKLAEQKLADFETSKKENLDITKSTVLHVAQELSSKLLNDHKRENEQVKKDSKEETVKVFGEIQKLVSVVATVKETNEKISGDYTTLTRMFSTSSAIGQFSENWLFNVLKEYGLIENVNFFYQSSFTGETELKRPDFVVKLPVNNLIVIDSKASKSFYDLAKTEGTEKEAFISEKLKRRMNEHLASLASKDYRDAARKFYEKAAGSEKINMIFIVMALHSDSAVEKIFKLDPEFQSKCINNGILVLGPAGLAGPLYAANLAIEREQQNQNNEVIITEVQNLLGNLSTTLSHFERTGKSIKSALDSFRQFGASINKNILPKARKIENLGVSLPKGKELPANIKTSSDGFETIEGEAEEVKQQALELEKST